MEFKDVISRAMNVQKKYNEWNEREYKRWGVKEYAEGLVGDVGDLMKLIQAKEGWRKGEEIDAKLRHELVDCLWSLIVIADHLDIDLEPTFLEQMDAMEQRVVKGEG